MPLRRDLRLYWWGMAIRISMIWRNTSVGNASYTWHSMGRAVRAFAGVIRMPFHIPSSKGMAGLQCACGSDFFATCEIEPAACALVWLLLVMSVFAHAVRCCGVDESGSDDDEASSTMYS